MVPVKSVWRFTFDCGALAGQAVLWRPVGAYGQDAGLGVGVVAVAASGSLNREGFGPAPRCITPEAQPLVAEMQVGPKWPNRAISAMMHICSTNTS